MNASNLVNLDGCTATPLASYLKALGVLRILATQVDSEICAHWTNGRLVLQTALSQDELLSFFRDRYTPSPLVAPWNGGSGFYEGDDTEARDAILASPDPRFRVYKEVIGTILMWPELGPAGQTLNVMRERLLATADSASGKQADQLRATVGELDEAIAECKGFAPSREILGQTIEVLEKTKSAAVDGAKSSKLKISAVVKAAKKVRSAFKKGYRSAGKESLVWLARSRLPDPVVECLDAMVPILSDGRLGYPPLFGSGGAEGRLDYSNGFMQHLRSMLLVPTNSDTSRELLGNALFGQLSSGLENASVGQHDPGRAGGFNQGPEVETKQVPMNPWNFILCLEGCIAWSSGAAKLFGRSLSSVLASPFTVAARSTGYESASATDTAKAEVWTPLWSRPATYREIQHLLREGRAEIGSRQAVQAVEFAQAAASLGAARGIDEFVRFSLLKRRGDSFVALPTGTFPTHYRGESDLVRELDPILRQVDRFLDAFGKKGPPARFHSARRRIDRCIYDLLLRSGASRVNALLAAVGSLEQLVAQRELSRDPKLNAPLGGLSVRWLLAADDSRPELRIAASLASIAGCGKVGPLRCNLAPVDPQKRFSWARSGFQMAWSGNSITARLANVLARRMMDAERLGAPMNPIAARLRLHPLDALTLTYPGLETTLLQDLLFGFSWLRWDVSPEALADYREVESRWAKPIASGLLSRPYTLLKLLFLPDGIREPSGTKFVAVRAEPSILPLLRSNRIGEACALARRRLYASGFAVCPAEFPDVGDGTALAAALLVPVRNEHTLTSLVFRKPDRQQ